MKVREIAHREMVEAEKRFLAWQLQATDLDACCGPSEFMSVVFAWACSQTAALAEHLFQDHNQEGAPRAAIRSDMLQCTHQSLNYQFAQAMEKFDATRQ